MALTVFKTVRDLTTSGWVGSIPMHSRQRRPVGAIAVCVAMLTTPVLVHIVVVALLRLGPLRAQRSGPIRAAADVPHAAQWRPPRDSMRAAHHAATRVLLFVPRARLLAERARATQGRGGVHARRGDQHRDDSRIGRRRARGATHRERHDRSCRTSMRLDSPTRRSPRRRASTDAQRAHARSARRRLGRAARRESSVRRRRRVRRGAICGTSQRASAFACSRAAMPPLLRVVQMVMPRLRAGRRLRLGHRRTDRRARSDSAAAARERHLFRRHRARAVRTQESRHRASLQPRDRRHFCAIRA